MNPLKISLLTRQINTTDRSFQTKWTCSVLINLFYPENWNYHLESHYQWLFLWRGFVRPTKYVYGAETNLNDETVIESRDTDTELDDAFFPYQLIILQFCFPRFR